MTVSNLRCDVCRRSLTGLVPGDDPVDRSATGGVRFAYHPGDIDLQDSSGTVCADCWAEWVAWLGGDQPGRCSVCGVEAGRWQSLHLRQMGGSQHWRLCAPHAADLLNRLDTVQPKFDRDTFRLPFADRTS